MSQLIQHYQTGLSIVKNQETEEVDMLYQVQFLIGEWVKAKEGKRFRAHKRNPETSFCIDGAFIKRAEYKSKYSWLKTDYCIMSNSTAWAMEYTHRDDKEKNIFWVSEIGLRYFNDSFKLVISVKISYKLSTEYVLTGKNYSPDISIPWCVAGLIETFKGCNFFSGSHDITKGIGKPIHATNNEILKEIGNVICARDRKLGIVLLCGDSELLMQEAAFLSNNMFAKALVYVVPYNMGNAQIRMLINRCGLNFGECLFIPPFIVHDNELQKRLTYKVDASKSSEDRRKIILRAWLGIHPVNEMGMVSDITNIQLLLRRELYGKVVRSMEEFVPNEKFEEIKRELDDVSGLFELSEEERKRLEEKVGELEYRNVELEETNETIKKDHKTEIYNMQMQQQGAARKASLRTDALPREYPSELVKLKAFENFYGNLLFSDSAWKSAEEYSKRFDEVGIAWEMLHDLNHILWGLIFDGRSTDIVKEFNSKSRFEYATGEGRMTNRNGELASQRKFNCLNQGYEMWKHVKYSNRGGKQLRIYFDIDQLKRKLVIGHIGDHLDNATTRTLH